MCRDELNLVGIPVNFDSTSGKIENPEATSGQPLTISESEVISNCEQQLMEEAERAAEDDNWFHRIIPTKNNQLSGGKYNAILNRKINSCGAQDPGRFCLLF